MKRVLVLLLCLALFAPALAEAPEDADEAYLQGLRFLEEGRYYSASVSFAKSGAADAPAQADACKQDWPKNGEIWRKQGVTGTAMELAVQVNQSEDTALYVRLYREGEAVSALFIGGSDRVTVRLPGGTYTILDGSGKIWYGLPEAFGRRSGYEAMTFDNLGTEEVRLQAGHSYTITINVSEPDPDADLIGSETVDWERIMQ